MSNPPSSYKPNPYFSGITYNATDFINNSKTALITYTDALTLFLQKNTPIPLNYLPSAITGTNQLGYKITPTFATTSLVAAAPTNIAQATCPAGIYLITANVYFNFPAGYSILSINTSVAVDTNCYVTSNYGTGSCIQISRVVNSNIDGTQTWILVAQTAGATTVGSVRFNVYRIG
jgi:hypothetical protein